MNISVNKIDDSQFSTISKKQNLDNDFFSEKPKVNHTSYRRIDSGLLAMPFFSLTTSLPSEYVIVTVHQKSFWKVMFSVMFVCSQGGNGTITHDALDPSGADF